MKKFINILKKYEILRKSFKKILPIINNTVKLPLSYGVIYQSFLFFHSNSVKDKQNMIEKPLNDNLYENEMKVVSIILKAEEYFKEENYELAKSVLNDALTLIEETKTFGNLSSVYELLVAIVFKEGSISEAEEMIVRFIERLIQLGYPDDNNSIIRFKLKLCRIYQMIGNREMAEIGFRSCINALENKIRNKKNDIDELTSLIYISSMYWYGIFITEEKDFQKAKIYMKKTLDCIKSVKIISPSQEMVVLYHAAEISFNLKEFDDSIYYLARAINLCKDKDPLNPDLPIYLAKIGIVFLYKGIYDKAKYWCENAQQFAKDYDNHEAEEEATICLNRLKELQK